MKYPCTYRKYGCREIYSFDFIGGHQENCRYIPQPCPVNKLNLVTLTGIFSSTKSHLKHTHRHMCTEDYGLFHHSFLITDVTPAKKYRKMIFFYNDVYYCCCEIKKGLFHSVLQYFVPAADAVKYQYKLELFNKKRTVTLAVTRLARSLDEDLSEVHNSGNCVKLYPEQFDGFKNENGELTFEWKYVKF